MTEDKFQNLRFMALLLFCAILLNIPAFINQYPFIFNDTSTYLLGLPRPYRAFSYMQFVQIVPLFKTVWVVPIAQGLVVSYVLYHLNRVIFGDVKPVVFIGQILILVAASSLPFFVGFITADIFTGVLLISYFILAFHHEKISKRTEIILTVLLVFSVLSHIANIYLLAGLVIFTLMLKLILRKPLGRLKLMFGVIGFSAFIFVAINVIYFKTVSMSPAAPNFMLANMVAQGPAKKYIQNTCPQSGYKICKYADELPSDVNKFLWFKEGLITRLGGIFAMREEAKTIIKNTIITYPKEVLQSEYQYFIKSFTKHSPVNEITTTVTDEKYPEFIELYLNKASRDAYMSSLQARGKLPYAAINNVDNIIYPLALFLTVLISLFSIKKYSDNRYLFPLFSLVFIAGNNLLCVVGSGVFDRYQARVSWLMVLGIILSVGLLIKDKSLAKVTKR